ncbi:MAG TPA: hypothetical protein VII78_20515 [Myxococcota bacterium]
MKRGLALLLLAVACAGPLPAKGPPGEPIAADLLCSERTAQPARHGKAGDLARCGAAVAPRIEAMKRAVLDAWLPTDPLRSSFVQIQFELDSAGLPVQVCVLGGTGDGEARSALEALARYQSPGPLSSEEQCALGDPLVASLIRDALPR